MFTLIMIDDHSRYVVGHGVDEGAERADMVIKTFEEAVARHGRPERVMDDKALGGASSACACLDQAAIATAKAPAGDEDQDMPALVDDLLRHPSAHFLRRLSIGGLGTTDEYSYIATVGALAKAAHPLLQEIVIGDFDPSMMELAFSRAGDVSPLLSTRATPALERLTLRSGSLRFNASIKHPQLKELRVVVADITRTTLDRLFSATLPNLESFELSCPNVEIEAGFVLRLLRNHPKLKTLALRQTTKTAAILDALLSVPEVLRQLQTLELDESDLDDAFVPRIESLASRLNHLSRLVISGPRLSPRGAARLSKLGGGIVQATSKARTIPISDADVVARAPDARSVAAARTIAKANQWLELARDGNRLWGELEGSDHYYVLASIDDAETRCTCPSAKDPCKHALALLFLAAAQHSFEERPVPRTLALQTRERPRYQTFWE